MPYDPNAEWTAATNAAAKEPVYYVAIDGLTTKHFSTGGVRAAAVTKKLLLKVPTAFGQKLSQLLGRSSLTIFSFDLVDAGNEITDLMSLTTLNTLINRRVTLYSGYATINEDKYVPVAVGQVRDVSMVDEVTYRISLSDLKRHGRDDISVNAEASGERVEATLSADLNAGSRFIDLVSQVNVEQDAFFMVGPSTHASFLGGEEKVKARIASIGTRVHIHADFPLLKSYKAGDKFRWATTVIEGNPVNMVYALWSGNFAHASFPLVRKEGLPTGLGIAASDIDDAYMIKERDRFLPELVWKAEFVRPEAGFRFLEQKIFRFVGYPFQTMAGKLALRLYRPWHADDAAALPEILQKDVLSWSWRRAHDLHVNKVVLGVDWDPAQNRAFQTVTVQDSADIAATNETEKIEEIESLVQSTLGQETRIAQGRGAVLLRRYLSPPLQLKVVCPLTKRALEIGETVALTHPNIPFSDTASRGMVKRRLEIVEKTEDPQSDEVTFLLQDAGFMRSGQQARPIIIGPPGAVTGYDAATAAQREFFYIGPPGSPPGNFDDGKPVYEII